MTGQDRAASPGVARIAMALFVACLAVYSARVRNGGSGDTLPAQLLPLSLLFDGNLDFNEFVCPTDEASGVAIDYAPGPCTAPLPYYFDVSAGRVVSRYPIVPGILNLPVHAVAAGLGADVVARNSDLTVLTAALISSASVAFLFLFLLAIGLTRSTAIFGALVYAFGTLVWSVTGRGLWQHGPSLLLINAALFLLARSAASARTGESSGASSRAAAGVPWAGFLLGLAVFNRPTNVLIALGLTAYVFRHQRREFIRFCALAAVPAAAMLFYSHAMLGSVTTLGQGQHMRFSAHPLEGLAGLLFSPARGLFVFSPIFLLGLGELPATLSNRARHPLVRYLVVSTLALIALHALWPIWWGGVSFGYRLITESVPGFVVLLALSWERRLAGIRLLRWLAALLLAVSVYFNFLGAQLAPCGFDSSPDHIDYHPERLWQLRDTELIRCTRAIATPSDSR